MLVFRTYVHENQHGALKIGDSRVSLDSVVYAYLRGDSPEAIRDQFPVLSLEEVYGAIATYLGNREEVDLYLQRQQQLWDEFRRESDRNPSPVVQRLRALKAARRATQA